MNRIMRKKVTGLLLWVMLTGFPVLLLGKTKSPNFILILTDDQSYVGTSFLANPEDSRTKSDYYQTPNMDRLAEMGMRFTNGYAPAPFCCPTRRSIAVGQTPARHEYQADRENWTKTYRNQLTIPQMLKKANAQYKTAHFGKWDFRYDMITPEEMGYDVSDGYTSNGTGGYKGDIRGPAALEDPKLIFSLTDRACRFLEEQKEQGNPFYLQVSHYAVHVDVFYKQETLDKYMQMEPGKKHYVPEFAAMTGDLDQGIGILLNKIEELGLLENTYILFMSDNGGRKSIPRGDKKNVLSNYPLRDGKATMYEGGIRVPFVMAGPGIRENSYSHVPVTGLDILPTLAELSGYNGPLPENIDGGSIMNVAINNGQGKVQRKNDFLIFHHAVAREPQTAIRKGNYKLVKTWRKNQLELFDLSQDVSENNNLVDAYPEIARELENSLNEFLHSVGAETKKK
jgi:arylsulfatase A